VRDRRCCAASEGGVTSASPQAELAGSSTHRHSTCRSESCPFAGGCASPLQVRDRSRFSVRTLIAGLTETTDRARARVKALSLRRTRADASGDAGPPGRVSRSCSRLFRSRRSSDVFGSRAHEFDRGAGRPPVCRSCPSRGRSMGWRRWRGR
jgi:hypothetical protein